MISVLILSLLNLISPITVFLFILTVVFHMKLKILAQVSISSQQRGFRKNNDETFDNPKQNNITYYFCY